MENPFIKKCETILNRIEHIKREVNELKLMYSIEVEIPKPPTLGKPSRFDFEDSLPDETVMPSNELVTKCREYSERKYITRSNSE